MNIILRIPIWLTLWISGTLSIKYLIAAVLNVRSEISIFRLFKILSLNHKNDNLFQGYRRLAYFRYLSGEVYRLQKLSHAALYLCERVRFSRVWNRDKTFQDIAAPVRWNSFSGMVRFFMWLFVQVMVKKDPPLDGYFLSSINYRCTTSEIRDCIRN